MNLSDVMDEIGEALRDVQGLEGRVHDFAPDNITPPAAIVVLPDDIVFDETYGRGSDRITLPVIVAVGRVSDRSARDQLAKYADGSGAHSVKTALEAYTYDSFDTVRVTRADFDILSLGTVDYLSAIFELDIVGQGTIS